MANGNIKTIQINGEEYDINALPEDGIEGQVLTKTDDGVKWSSYLNFWKGTLTEYVAIKDKDPDCIYFIVENDINTTSDDDTV